MADSNSDTRTSENGFRDADYLLFTQKFEKLSGIPLRLYKEKQMKRRIRTLIERKNLNGYEEFLVCLKADPELLESFLNYITINVTEFFRTPEHWERFEQEVLPDLLSCREGRLRIWSCACATGEEAYSLAMSLLRITDPSRFHILATDLNERVLRFAEEGVYAEKCFEKVPKESADRFFQKKGAFRIASDELKSCVEFRRLDLLKDPYPSDLDLIVCRNVLIYFTEEAKEKIYTDFRECLHTGGYLFTGNTEQIIYYKKFGYGKIENYSYRKL